MKKLERITIGCIDQLVEQEKTEYLGKGYLEIELEDFVKNDISHFMEYSKQFSFNYLIPEKNGRRNSRCFKFNESVFKDIDRFEALERMDDFLTENKYYLTDVAFKKRTIFSNAGHKLSGRFYEERKI